jgi:hypothetical protein
MQNTIRMKLQEKANEIAREKINGFDLASEFGLDGELEIQVSGQSGRGPRGVLTSIRTTLDDLSDEVRTFLEDALPAMLFDILLKEHLDAEQDAKEAYADSVNDRVREEGR